MQLPLILLLLIVILIGGLFGASYVYTPEAPRTEINQEIPLDKLAPAEENTQPAEYP